MSLKRLGALWLLTLLSAASLGAADVRLIDAIKAGDRPAALALLKQRVDINAAEADGTTALHWAVHGDDVQAVELLLRAGAGAKTANRYGVTPLMLAATNGSAAVIDQLVKAGADVNEALPEGQTVLMTAARTGNPQSLKTLVAHGANVNAQERWLGETALMWAAAENHADAVRLLVESGADPNVHSTPTTFKRKVGGQTILTRGGFTAAMYAARQGAIDAARALAEKGADLDQKDPDGVTALNLAIINAHYDVAATLLEYGADPNVADSTGMTPLYAAIDMNTLQFMHGRPAPKASGRLNAVDVAKMLLTYGADPNARLKTPILQRHNNAPNQTLGEGTTPLMRAAKSGDVGLMRVLIDAGADPTLRQKNQNTLLILASGFGRKFDQNSDAQEYERGTEEDLLAAVKFCVDLGLDLNAANEGGETAAHVAAGGSIVRYLAQHGARLDAKNKQGKTPFDVAILRKDRSGRQLLPGAVEAFSDLGAPATVARTASGPQDEPVVAGDTKQQ